MTNEEKEMKKNSEKEFRDEAKKMIAARKWLDQIELDYKIREQKSRNIWDLLSSLTQEQLDDVFKYVKTMWLNNQNKTLENGGINPITEQIARKVKEQG